MSKKYWESKDFKDLQSQWNDKLKDDGFEDIEQDDGNLKRWDSVFFKINQNDVQFEAKETYYRLAGNFLYEHKFANELERTIWKMHSTGESLRHITKALEKSLPEPITQYKVYETLKPLIKLMKQKYKIVDTE